MKAGIPYSRDIAREGYYLAFRMILITGLQRWPSALGGQAVLLRGQV